MQPKSDSYVDRIKHPGPHDPVYFYPPEYYVFDNFSSFQVDYAGFLWPTSEHAFQAALFKNSSPEVYDQIKKAKSAHDAKKIADANQPLVSKDLNQKEIMKDILRHKINQHPYVLKKLLQSGGRPIIEDSWRDSEWGWGDHKDGQNILGKIWMELRAEY